MHLRISQRFLLQTLVILLSLGLSVLSSSSSESENAGPSGFDKLTVGKNTYYKVRVNAVTPDAITIFHSKGITKVPLSKLSPDLQKAFNFDPEESANYLQEQRQRSEQAIAERQRLMKAAQARSSEKESSDLLQKLNAPIELKESMDLRPRIRELSLISKSQGLRPSCAVFAVVSALEIQSARHTNRAARLSEEYLIWATRKSLGLDKMASRMKGYKVVGADAGFALMEVVSAVRSYGVPTQSEMPNTFGKGMDAIESPPEQLIQNARERGKITAYNVAARDPSTSLEYIVKILNEKQPVVIGMGWPTWRKLGRGHFLSKQTAREGYAHAVTLVGYKCETGRLEDTRFIFKNSYGVSWGMGGYGIATYEYLLKNLGSAIYLDTISI
ncbi:C1 family peptidase [Opitutia bacterium ISCC 51]|nr:C1 family peptidase [Opitutae bacterium ISCC 51]QXD27200.1 C1 family peptidase [Opitutae bacterium ISCC 52]